MRINVFEGSRRIVWLIAVIAVAIAGWNLLFSNPIHPRDHMETRRRSCGSFHELPSRKPEGVCREL